MAILILVFSLGVAFERYVVNGGESKLKRQEYARLLVLKQEADLLLMEWNKIVIDSEISSLSNAKDRTLSDEEVYNFEQLKALLESFSGDSFEHLDLIEQYRFLYYQTNVVIALLYYSADYSDMAIVSQKFFLEFFEHNKTNFEADWLTSKDIVGRNIHIMVNIRCLNFLSGIESKEFTLSLDEKRALSRRIGGSLEDNPILGRCL